jgi:hypothetical protein
LFAFEQDGRMVGYGGVEILGEEVLLRSIVVSLSASRRASVEVLLRQCERPWRTAERPTFSHGLGVYA